MCAPGAMALGWRVASAVEKAGAEFVGDWALTLPSGEAGWLAVRASEGGVTAESLWAVGSARPLPDARIEAGALHFTQHSRGASAAVTGRRDGDVLRLEMRAPDAAAPVTYSGKRMPPLPPRPDLARVRFGEAIALCNGRDLTGWCASDPAKKNGWSVRDGVLRNDTPKRDFSAYGDHANLRTDAEFTDFRLRLEYRLPPEIGGNSGVYLRGLYEVQVTHRDSSMQGIQGSGAVFGRIAPTHNAGQAAGEWEALEVTLVDRHITVVLNGARVIDNAPIAGPTGGALHSDVTRSGPLLLQGDHTSVEYRRLFLHPRIADLAP